MEMRITARHFDLTDELKDYIDRQMEFSKKYADHIISAHIILEIEKHRQKSELNLTVNGQSFSSHAVTDDMYVSIDETANKMDRQLAKYYDRFRNNFHLTRDEKASIAEDISRAIAPEEQTGEQIEE